MIPHSVVNVDGDMVPVWFMNLIQSIVIKYSMRWKQKPSKPSMPLLKTYITTCQIIYSVRLINPKESVLRTKPNTTSAH